MKKFIELLTETLEIEDFEVKAEDNFRDYEEWDSLAFLSLQAMINEEYGITIPRDEFDSVETVNGIFALIQKRL